MRKKDQIRQNTILGVAVIIFMGVLFIMSWIIERIPAKIYRKGLRK